MKKNKLQGDSAIKPKCKPKRNEKLFIIKQKINSLFDYWEIDKERLFIEME